MLIQLLRRLTAFLALSFLLPASAGATLVDLGSSILDDQTNLEWLKVAPTVGLSVQDFLDGTGNTFLADGWRLATTGDVCVLTLAYQNAYAALKTCPGSGPGGFDYSNPGQPIRDALGFTFYEETYNPIYEETVGTEDLWAYFDDGNHADGVGAARYWFWWFVGAPGPRSEGHVSVLESQTPATEAHARKGLLLVRGGAPCFDSADNDGDGLVDGDDPGCQDDPGGDETAPGLVCDNGLDDDGDGFADAGPTGDPGCRDGRSAREDPQCQDGLNNDNRVGTDFDGGVSILGAGNGDPAGADPDCGSAWDDREATSPNATCGLGPELALALPLLLLARRRSRKV